jgi:cytochrome c oxidase subunit IV
MSSATTAHHEEPNYMAIFWYLLVLTIAEVGATYLPFGKVVVGSLLVSMALAKAALVAMFFMHLKFENKTLGVIAVTPLIICVWLLFMLMPDSNPNLRIASEVAPAPAAAAPEPAEH